MAEFVVYNEDGLLSVVSALHDAYRDSIQIHFSKNGLNLEYLQDE